MTPSVEHTTSVQVAFKASSTSSASSNVSATLIDKRNHLHINLVPNMNTFVSAQVQIDHLPATNSSTLKSFSLKPGHNYIGTSDTVGMTDIRYDFEDGYSYSIKIICLSKESGSTPSSVLSYYSYRTTGTLFDNLESYSFLFRSNGGSGDSFNNPEINNPSDIENGSDIIISCPLVLEPRHDASNNPVLDGSSNPVFVDTRTPHHLLFTFDEEDTYSQTTPPNSDNTEQLAEYSAYLPYESNGIYTLKNNTLKNDAIYVVSVSGIYSDGHVISTTILKRVHVITSPVIASLIAYGIDKASVPGTDKLEGEDPSVSTVMNVFLTSQSSPMNVQEANNKITFYLSQKNSNDEDVVRYSSEVDISTTVVGGLIKYNILNDVTDEEIFVPVNEPEADNNTYDVYCTLEYINLNDGDDNIVKRSNVVTATFTADITSLPQDFFGINNAWVAASVTEDEDGRRQVDDLGNPVSADGYTAAPAFGIVGEFRKNDYYGSGNTVNELFKDLDLVDTQHKFMLGIGIGTGPNQNVFNYTPVNYLYQMQEDEDITLQENYVNLMKKQMIYEQNGVETVLTNSEVANVKADSKNIISSSPSGTAENGWSILNTDVNTNGATGGALPKVNLYFYGNATPAANQNANNSFKMSQASGLGLYAVFYQNSGAKEYPFFNVYTTTSGNVADPTINKASWYKSRILYSPTTANGNTVENSNLVGLTLVYTGTDDLSLFADIPIDRRVKYEMNESFSNRFSDSDNELVNLLSLHTSSNATTSSAGNFNFRLLETGMVTSHASFGKVALRYNQPKPRLLYSANGLFPNIPDPSSASGSTNWGTNQPRILFWIPQNNMYVQQNAVKVSIAIIAPDSVLPPETESNNYSIVVHKVNRYEMAIGTSSEPRFTGSGSEGVLKVPINNPTSNDNDFYFSSATFVSNASDNVTQQRTTDDNGSFDLTVTNPSIRGVGTTCDYKVYYTIDDPNGSNIDGPLSEQYSINLKDKPTGENFDITDYTYKTFNGEGESSFQFTVTFSDGDETSIDGLHVYFVSDNGDDTTSNNIGETLVADVSRKIEGFDTNVQTISVMLATASSKSSTSAATDGVKIKDIKGNLSSKTWLNFRSGTIRFRPYHTAKVVSYDDEHIEITAQDHQETINNIPVIDPVNHQTVSLVGGVIESYKDSVMEWTNDLSDKYGSISTLIDASHDLTVNGVTKTDNINEGSSSYDISLVGTQPTQYTLSLTVKVVALSDNSVYWSEPVVLIFSSVSVDQTPMIITVKRGSNHQTLKIIRGNYTTSPTPTSNLNVTKVELVNNPDGSDNQNPEKDNVVIIQCTNQPSNAIQPTGSEQFKNSYNISSYTVGDVLQLVYRVEAGVNYTVSDNASISVPLYLTLYANSLPYRVADIPSIDIDPHYNVKSSSDADNGQMSINLSINAKGLANEGLTGVVIVLAQEGDFTSENDGDANGASVSLIFNSSQFVTYEVEAEAATDNNMNIGEIFEFTDSKGHTWRFVTDNLDGGNTRSVLYFPSGMNGGTLNGGFNNTKDLLAVGVASTRLGTAATDGFLDITRTQPS